MVPDKRFSGAPKNDKRPISIGIFPAKLLYPTEKSLNNVDERFPKEDGIRPVRLFESAKKASSFTKEPCIASKINVYELRAVLMKLVGILPPNMLSERRFSLYKLNGQFRVERLPQTQRRGCLRGS